jgi:DNA-binding NarL/FixJ family response regulator
MAEGSNAPGGNGARKRPGKQQPPSGASDGQCRRVVVVSDTRLLRDGVALALARCGVLHVVGSADVAEAPALVIAQRPDAVLLEAGGAGGLELPRLLRDVLPGLHVVVFAIADGDADIVAWAEAGASGYVGRDGSAEDLASAVDGALRGEVFCSARLAGLLFARVAELSGRATPAVETTGLTSREREVVVLVEQGLPNKEIARRLGIGHATVKNHVHRILEKMHARGRGEAAARLRREQAGGREWRSPSG